MAELRRFFDELYKEWADRVNTRGGLDPVVIELSKALNSLRNARDLEANPGSAVTAVFYVNQGGDGRIHAADPRSAGDLRAISLCGFKAPFDVRVYTATRVPTCPECLEIMRKLQDER